MAWPPTNKARVAALARIMRFIMSTWVLLGLPPEEKSFCELKFRPSAASFLGAGRPDDPFSRADKGNALPRLGPRRLSRMGKSADSRCPMEQVPSWRVEVSLDGPNEERL